VRRGAWQCAVRLAVLLLLPARQTMAADAGMSSPLTPYRAIAWTAPTPPLPHVVGVVRYQSSSDPAAVAAALNHRPAGARALLRWESNDNRFWKNPADLLPIASPASQPSDATTAPGPWLEHGAAAEAAFESRFAEALHRLNTRPDFLVLDTEMGIGTWSLTSPQLSAIGGDRRWSAVARQFGIRGADDLVGVTNSPAARAFNLAMQVTTAAYFRAGYFLPWRKIDPSIGCSDFGDGVLNEAQAAQAVDDDGNVQPMALPMHGNMQSPCCYAWVHKIGQRPCNQGADFRQPLPALCWITSMVRGYAQSPEPMLPWIAARSWTDGHVLIANTPYQDELVWQVCLSAGCTDVLYFNPDARAADDAAMDGDLAALERQARRSPTLTPLTTAAVPFASPVLVSGARCADGRRVYRVTTWPAAAAPRVLRVMLPGEIIETAVTVPAGEVGAWVVR
jgi:hypothetical protein